MSAAAESPSRNGAVYLACVPHLPFMVMQDRDLNAGFWDAYENQAAAIRRFDPEVVFVFGSDHYEGQHMKAMVPFMVGQAAAAIDDRGGYPGRLNVPGDIALACTEYLMAAEFDVGVSHDMRVDHGFSSVLHHMLGAIDANPVVPVFVNALAHPRPSFRRCRRFGDAVGRFAAGLGKRVAFLGSGGLSHETGEVYPQVSETTDPATRDWIIRGDEQDRLSREQWRENLNQVLDQVNKLLIDRVPRVGNVNNDWDRKFLDTLTSNLDAFDDWADSEVLATAGNGGGEVREWITAAAAARAAGASEITIDYYAAGTAIGVGAVVVHAS